MKYVALLRGINVGGNNLIKMAELELCFERQGFGNVSTYIQSGNVIFEAGGGSRAELTNKVERALSTTFGYSAKVVLRSQKQLQQIVTAAPKGFGKQPAKYRTDVIFLKEPLTVALAMKTVLTRPGVDQVHAGRGVLYFSRLVSQASRSLLGKIVGTPVYQNMTIRNWNTTTKLLALMAHGD
ncbi:MAG TPA: DUF1697 domain-containing protein [Polyangiaceae bacterium]|nr:DUF1697 domain-containing protein [Polyangiaceae bacterium]